MLFDYLDIQILRRIIVRKSCEIAAATFDQSLSETERSIKVRILAGQINYARCIAKIGVNDLTEFEEMMDTLTEGCPPMPTEMFSSYLDRLDREDMEDEGHFVWMIQELTGQTPLLMMALDIFRDGRPECSLTDSDSLVFRRVMDLMDRASERCSGQDPEILEGITDYISVTRGECSVLLRIASLGNVESSEISKVCISLGTVSEEGFDSMFGDILDMKESEALAAFRREMPRYVAAMYARCAFNSDYPLSSERNLSPRNRFKRIRIRNSISHRHDSCLMWDANLITRVRDRKLNEIMVFASMAKIDSSNVDTYIDIIVSLGDDIDACDTLLDTEGETAIELDPLDSPEYLSRLSPSERADEDAFNALKSEPTVEGFDDELLGSVREIIRQAAESLNTHDDSDALASVMDELKSCRARVDEMSSELEFARGDAQTARDQLSEAEAERDRLSEENGSLRATIASLKTDLMLAEQKLSVLESAYSAEPAQEAQAPVEEEVTEPEAPSAEPEPVEQEPPVAEVEGTESETPAPEPEPEEAPADEAAVETQGNVQGAFLSREKVDIIHRVRDMKDSKIDLFLDSAVNGDIPLDVCDDIVDFLKTDISVCDAILSIDFQDHDSVLDGFRRIITVLSESRDPQHQDEYVGSLMPEEAQLEYGYSQVLNSLQGMMMYLRDEL